MLKYYGKTTVLKKCGPQTWLRLFMFRPIMKQLRGEARPNSQKQPQIVICHVKKLAHIETK